MLPTRLRGAFRIDMQTLNASAHLIAAHPDLEAFGLYLGGFDTTCHSLWNYRFPEESGASLPPEDVAALGPLLDSYVAFLDASLQRLIGGYRVPVNVVIVSDHGYKYQWHDPHGFFLASGPSIPPGSKRLLVSYYDVVPTLLELGGFEQPATMRGTALFVPPY